MPRRNNAEWSYVPHTPKPEGGKLRAIDTATGEAVAHKRGRRILTTLPPDDVPPTSPVPKPPRRFNARKAQRNLFRRLRREEMARQAAIRAEVYAAGLIPWAEEDEPDFGISLGNISTGSL